MVPATEANSFAATTRLRRLEGMRGYGIYCRLVEVCNAAPGRWTRYDLEDFAYDMREDKEIIKRIAEDYDLFVIRDDRIADAFSQTAEAKERERKEQIHRNRSEAAKKAAATRKARKAEVESTTTENAVEPEPEPEPERKPAPKPVPAPVAQPQRREKEYESDFGYVDYTPEQLDSYKNVKYADNFSQRLERAKIVWNEVFKRKNPRRVVNDIIWSSAIINSFRQTAQIYTDQDVKDAIEQASKEKFVWQFQDVLKPTNIQRLLSNAEAERQQAIKERGETEEVAPEVQELIDFGDRMGWNWDK